MSFHPSGLFQRTALTLTLASTLLLLVALGAVAYFVNLPLGRQATDDLAALIVLSAQTWVELPPETRPDFEREMIEHHGLIVRPADKPLANHTTFFPYRILLEQALAKRLGHPVQVRTTHNPDYYWVDIPVGGKTLRVGFAQDRVGTQQPYALVIIFAAMLIMIIVTALILARRITSPLTRMAQAAQELGHGTQPSLLPETGPAELATLSRSFNHMAQDVRELLANRTTLLAGVSHDLRTPLARMRLAIEMLPEASDPKLHSGIVRDLDIMDSLLAQYLALARGMIEETIESIDLRELVDGVVADTRRVGTVVNWTPGPVPVICAVRPHALERIVTNLIDNARRYGEGKAIDVECVRVKNEVVIRILDRGPGIPSADREAVFRPFHRMEDARSSAGGGSGLGLAIAQQLAKASGWFIDMEARPEGGLIVSVRMVCETPD